MCKASDCASKYCLFLGSVMEGKYEAKATFFSKASPDRILGCMDLTFSLKQCDA